jgi:clavulanate-9-aldehyde reducatase
VSARSEPPHGAPPDRKPQSAAAPSPFPPIADYGFLSNCHTGALVARDGAIDWLCVPRFDSPSVFGSLLDRGAGAFRLGPFGVNVPTARVYEPGTNSLLTTWNAPTGWILVRDALTIGPRRHADEITPHTRPPTDDDADHMLVRTVFCLSGSVDVELVCEPSGIGEATALALAQAGAAVALAGRRADRLEALAERIEDGGGRALAVPTDVADEAQASAFVRRADEELGGLSILVNSAGVMLLGPVEGANADDWRRMVDVNLLGLLYCTAAALPLIRESGGGDIVNISSTAGRFATAGSAVYNLTKFGVNAFTEALRQEALHAKVRVSVVEPGFVATELQEQNVDPAVQKALEQMRERIGEVLQPEDIARAIVYVVGQPTHVGVSEILVRPAAQQP